MDAVARAQVDQAKHRPGYRPPETRYYPDKETSMPEQINSERAAQVAAEIVEEYGQLPLTIATVETIAAYAYAVGARDGYEEATRLMRFRLDALIGENESLDDLSDPSNAEVQL
jgi:hypothetical protein